MDRDAFIKTLDDGKTFANGVHNPVKLERFDGRYTLSGNGFLTAADSYEFVKDDPNMIIFTKSITIENKTVGILKFIITCSDWKVSE